MPSSRSPLALVIACVASSLLACGGGSPPATPPGAASDPSTAPADPIGAHGPVLGGPFAKVRFDEDETEARKAAPELFSPGAIGPGAIGYGADVVNGKIRALRFNWIDPKIDARIQAAWGPGEPYDDVGMDGAVAYFDATAGLRALWRKKSATVLLAPYLPVARLLPALRALATAGITTRDAARATLAKAMPIRASAGDSKGLETLPTECGSGGTHLVSSDYQDAGGAQGVVRNVVVKIPYGPCPGRKAALHGELVAALGTPSTRTIEGKPVERFASPRVEATDDDGDKSFVVDFYLDPHAP